MDCGLSQLWWGSQMIFCFFRTMFWIFCELAYDCIVPSWVKELDDASRKQLIRNTLDIDRYNPTGWVEEKKSKETEKIK